MNRTKETTSFALLLDYFSNSVHCGEARQYKEVSYIDKGLAQALQYFQVTVTAAVQRVSSLAALPFSLYRLTTTNYNFRTVIPAFGFRFVAGNTSAGNTSAGGACLSGATTVTPVALRGKRPSEYIFQICS